MENFAALQPVIILLVVGITAIMLARAARLSPLVGYLVAGVLIGPHGLGLAPESATTHLLAELGVVFLLFDIGVHFSLNHLWDARRAILGFGPLQVALCTLGLAACALAVGYSGVYAVVIGATLALSSTAVAVQMLTEHGQERCPIGVTATAVLIFQDICAIFLLILAASLDRPGISLGGAFALAACKAALAFAVAMLAGRLLIGPLFNTLARSRNEEIFTATALLIVLTAAQATGLLGLSLTLGAFLGGMIISETPYRHVIRTEVKPFRGLLLGFFFITVGMSLDPALLLRAWPQILLLTAFLMAVKAALIFAAARLLRTPVQGAIQLGFVLSQGSEFAFVILAMPVLQTALGAETVAIMMAGVAASLALTPPLTEVGYRFARRWAGQQMASCQACDMPVAAVPPVIIFGMGAIGRCVADGLDFHGLPYTAIEMDHERFIRATADGYTVAFGDLADVRLLETLEIGRRMTVVVTIIRYEVSEDLTPILRDRYPRLTRYIAVDTEEQKVRFAALGMKAVVDRNAPRGLELAAALLQDQGVDAHKIQDWLQRQREQALEAANPPLASAQAA